MCREILSVSFLKQISMMMIQNFLTIYLLILFSKNTTKSIIPWDLQKKLAVNSFKLIRSNSRFYFYPLSFLKWFLINNNESTKNPLHKKDHKKQKKHEKKFNHNGTFSTITFINRGLLIVHQTEEMKLKVLMDHFLMIRQIFLCLLPLNRTPFFLAFTVWKRSILIL